MTLNEFNSRPLVENLAEMDTVDMKVFTNSDTTEITCVELKYRPKVKTDKNTGKEVPDNGRF